MCFSSTSILSRPRCTGVSALRRTAPFKRTRPAEISAAACAREQYPSFEIARASPTFRLRFVGLSLVWGRLEGSLPRTPQIITVPPAPPLTTPPLLPRHHV